MPEVRRKLCSRRSVESDARYCWLYSASRLKTESSRRTWVIGNGTSWPEIFPVPEISSSVLRTGRAALGGCAKALNGDRPKVAVPAAAAIPVRTVRRVGLNWLTVFSLWLPGTRLLHRIRQRRMQSTKARGYATNSPAEECGAKQRASAREALAY